MMPKKCTMAAVLWLGLVAAAGAQFPISARIRGGRIHYDGARYDLAKKQFTEALTAAEASPDSVRADILIWLGLSEARLGSLDSARAHLGEAHSLVPAMTARLNAEQRWIDLLASLRNDQADSLATFGDAAVVSTPGILVPVQRSGLWGFADAQGNIVIEPGYDAVREFHEGLAAVMLIESIESPDTAYDLQLWGYIDTTGDTIIGHRFEQAGDFADGSAIVVEDGAQKCIDHSGEEWEPEESGVDLLGLARADLVKANPEANVSFWQDWAIVRETPTDDGDMPALLLRWKNGEWTDVASTREGFFYSSSIIEYVPDLTPDGREALGLFE